MAKRTRAEKHIHTHEHPLAERENQPISFKSLGTLSWALPLILIITFVAYLPVLQGGFVWDDVNYIQKNPQLHSIDLGQIFSGYVMGNYHPFTMLTFTVE